MRERRLLSLRALRFRRALRGSALDSEVAIATDFLVVDVDLLDPRAARAGAERLLHFRHDIRFSFDDGLDAAVGKIPHPAHRTCTTGGVLREPAEAHTLDAPADDEPSRNLHSGGSQL